MWDSLATAGLSLGLVSVLTIPSLLGIFAYLRQTESKNKAGLYQDQDGIATEASADALTAKWPKIFLSVSIILGLSSSIALAVIGTVQKEGNVIFLEDWFGAIQWFLLAVQTICILSMKDSVKCFALGIYAAISSAILLAFLFYLDAVISSEDSVLPIIEGIETITLRTAQLVLAIFAVFACMSLPRRPTVYHAGEPVDGMYNVSALGRYSFAWVAPLLRLARQKSRLELEDLPRMDHYTRSKDLSDAWQRRKHTRRLWTEIFLQHRRSFVTQWVLTLVQAVGLLAPSFVTFKLLRLLEERQPGSAVGPEAWFWAIALTIVIIGASLTESWLFWISWSQLAIPVRSQVSALIFQKAMRRKNVKGASKSKKTDAGAASSPADISESNSEDKHDTDDEDGSDMKGKQSTVNLIGVDAKRIADFCSYNNYFPGSLIKVIFAFIFLLSITGLQPLIAGCLAMSVITPLNIYFSKRYAAAQDKLMKLRDIKMGVVNEALQGIRQIKFSALERNWHNKIGKVRNKELAEQWNAYKSDTVLFFCWISGPIALAATSLSVYAYINGELSPSVAFTSIGVFSSLEVTLGLIPELTTDLIDAIVSVRRIEAYLNAPEITQNTNDSADVSFDDASVAWPSDEEDKKLENDRYVLRHINVAFPSGELSVVSGKTGTGKSLLLAALLGEVDVLSGRVNVPQACASYERHDHLATSENWIIPAAIAYVAQIPWIENATIKDNIIFGLPFDRRRYNTVIKVCALRKDLQMLPDGEDTEIGANGINLSGGQRWRVTFARALYSRAGILVLDDIFSAVDAHVGRYIFENGLTGELGIGRTRILVTHHVALCLSRTKYIVELGEGSVEHAGYTSELESAGTLQKIISHEQNEQEVEEDTEITAVNSEESSDGENLEQLRRTDSKKPTKKFVEEEARETGHVKMAIYKDYMKSSGGWPFWSIVMLAFGLVQALVTGRAWWVRLWTGSYEHHSSLNQTASAFSYTMQTSILSTPHYATPLQVDREVDSLRYYLGVYVAISLLSALLGTFRYWCLFSGSIRASKKLFDKLSLTILHTPLRWIDTVPLGRILNRFTADFNVVDAKLSLDIGFCGNNLFRLLGVIVAGLFVSPYMIVLSLVLLGCCVRIAQLYMAGAREVKRLESNAKSPVFEQFGSALTGITTIRAFDKAPVFITRMNNHIDRHATAFWYLWAFNRWMGFRMSLVGGFFASIVAVLVVALPNIESALAGFALAFSLEYGPVIVWTIRHYANLELDMNSAERIIEYSNLPTESLDGADPPAAWPTEGRLEVRDLVVSYAPDLPPVLKGLSFSVQRNERIGVVGRTGAGKSSLTLALFRFLEAREGSIHIDGLDISKLKLHALRSRLAIIPQDPVLFSGTVRSNLDAFGEHTDSELRDSLERVHLVTSSEFMPTPANGITSGSSTSTNSGSTTTTTLTDIQNKNPFTSLSSPVSEGGLNLSQGQRQLLCLARAIVARPKIMVLDEATSAVDMATDTLIQRSIREEFGDSTLIVIAHRLSTIADFDKILVLDDGKAVEFGTPKELMRIESGVFRGMIGESGDGARLRDEILGVEKGE